jgi:DNA-directed RNA polymerase subunit RPC12/RpoP
MTYAHYVCFDCRKAWAPGPLQEQDKRPCPDCGKPLIGLGLAFKPPKQRNRRAWLILEVAARGGNRFLKP